MRISFLWRAANTSPHRPCHAAKIAGDNARDHAASLREAMLQSKQTVRTLQAKLKAASMEGASIATVNLLRLSPTLLVHRLSG